MTRSAQADLVRQQLPEEQANERRELAEFVHAVRSGQVDTIVGVGGESKILRLLDAKVVEENERLVRGLSEANAKLEVSTKTLAFVNQALGRSEGELIEKNRITNAFLAIEDEHVYPEVLQLILNALNGDCGAIGLIDEQGRLLVPSTIPCESKEHFTPQQTVGGTQDAPRTKAWQRALREKRYVLTNDLPSPADDGTASIYTHITFPIIHLGDAIGLVQVGGRGRLYDDRDVKLLHAITEHIAPILAARLRKESEERARKRAERQLILSNTQLEKANRFKDEFLARMSHELRTPLNSIIGFTEMMIYDAKDPPVEKRAKRLEKVHRNAENLLALINDILDISKIGAKQFILERESVDVAALITDCIESAEPLIKKDAVELRRRLDESLVCQPNWTGDARRLQQIVMNLIGNAAKFTERGHVEVRGSVIDGSLVIEVEDTGLGIPTEHLSRVFDDFHQVDSSTTRRAGGTGLGLAICKKMCQLMGGEITARSTLGVGSVFTVRLPITEIPADADDAHAPPVLYAGTQDSVHRVGQFVENVASRIACVTEVRRAVEYCQQRSPGILYIDPLWHDALELLATLKRCDSTQHIPIGLLGLAADRAALVTFDDCIALSLGKDTLHRILRGTCDSPRSRVLLFMERRADNQYLSDMLAEFPDIAAVTTASARDAEERIAGGELDAVLVDLLDTRAEGLDLVARHERTRCPARPCLIAVTPRDPSSEDVLALSRAFELHIAKQGRPVDRILGQLCDDAVPRAALHQAECGAR